MRNGRWVGLVLLASAAWVLRSAAQEPGTILTVAGTGQSGFSGDGGRATRARLNLPRGVAVNAAGDLFIADTANDRIRKVSPEGKITTVAGTGTMGFSGDGGPAIAARLNCPYGVAADGIGNFYIADCNNHRVRRVSPEGIITTVAGSGPTGSGRGGFAGDDGPATAARLNDPLGVAVDRDGSLYIAECQNHRVRRVSLEGVITTVAGNGGKGFEGENVPASQARLDCPSGVAVDQLGNLFIADKHNHRVRKVSPDGKITTVAGTGRAGFAGDDGPAIAADLILPVGIAVDTAGNLFILDVANHRVRKVTPDGRMTTVAGTGREDASGDGGLATEAGLQLPRNAAVDRQGNLFIVQSDQHRVRKVFGVAAPGLLAGQPFP